MARLVYDIDALLHAADRGVTYPDDLTAREVEVLRLLAIGRTNKDVSLVLAISLNTVATHVRNILNKTQCANRTEAAPTPFGMGFMARKRTPPPANPREKFMALFMIERNFATVLNVSAEEATGVVELNASVGVKWLHSFLLRRQEEHLLSV